MGEGDETRGIYGHLSVLSEPVRVRLLRLLEREELGVGELAAIVQLPQSTVSRHLKLLGQAGLVARRAEGTSTWVRMAGEAMAPEVTALWTLVRDAAGDDATRSQDFERMEQVVDQRRLDSQAFFGRVATQWSELRRELFGEAFTLPALLALVSPRLRVADLGCGTGEALVELAPVVARLIGVDQAEAMLEAAAARVAGAPNVELRRGELSALPLADAEVDAALCMLVLHHIADIPQAFAEVRRVLDTGGALIVVDMVRHDRVAWRHTMGHAHLGFSEATLAE
ncbi:MAG: metalloregulator ArsR/SmtB family transcription factor, partial [Myxococcales bacterium]|nr:metalloregulator ArsR/SmtB family transcription factor [Myxococcales bacterium]